jgi:NhaP-type Na+/H+ or K+/H+ antiporter
MIRTVTGVLVVSVLLAGYALVSRRLRTTPLTAPMLFLAAGVILGPDGTDTIHGALAVEAFRSILEAALVLVLFTDAASVASFSRDEDRVPIRLLGIGLPLSIGLGWLVAKLVFPSMPLWEAALLGAVLAPTDAALGEAVIANPRVPRLIRDALNVESGLNDGLALPFVTVFIALAAEQLHAEGQLRVPDAVLRALVLSPLLGVAIGSIGGWALRHAAERGWTSPAWSRIGVAAIAFVAVAATVGVEGSGFIGAWVAGFAAGRFGGAWIQEHADLSEALGALLATIGFFAFGVLFVGPNLSHLWWAPIGYAIVSLTVIRLLPVGLALVGSGLRRPSVAYLGWFGPRGLASIVFMLLAIDDGARTDAFVLAVTATVLLSVYLHGATAVGGSDRYARWFEWASRDDPSLVEATAGTERRRRRSLVDRSVDG